MRGKTYVESVACRRQRRAGYAGYFSAVLGWVEGMQDETQGVEVVPDVVHVADVERAVEDQPGKDVGNLIRQHGRSMQAFAGVQPALQLCLSRRLAFVIDYYGE